MSRTHHPARVGELRPSQLLHTYGAGAIIDLPRLSALVLGNDYWDIRRMKEIREERLLAAVRGRLGAQVERLCMPPMPESVSDKVSPFDRDYVVGVPVMAFNRWMRCPYCRFLGPLESGLFELKAEPYRPDRTRYVHSTCKKHRASPAVLPVRFLVACEHGHLDDFPWVEFVHMDRPPCGRPIIELLEYGVSGTANDVLVKCVTCEARQPMSRAFGDEGKKIMPTCRGRRPHLGDVEEDGCKAQMRAILLGASNSWFPVTLAALSLPTHSGKIEQLVDEQWPLLVNATSREILTAFDKSHMLSAFADFTLDAVWKAIQAKRNPSAPAAPAVTDLKEAEWKAFSEPDATLHSADFRLSPQPPPAGYEKLIEKVVLAERLREVRALLGFTRLVSPGDFADVEEIPPDACVPLSRRPARWLTASEVRGEGIFIQIRESALQQWERAKQVAIPDGEFRQAHVQWRQARHIPFPEAGFPGLRRILLHSFSHALMRQFALECGYTAASLQERIYTRIPGDVEGDPMAGILIYTAASDSEGTLGGLVSLGVPDTLARHIEQALEQMRLCASDPLCAEHQPHTDAITLHGAACHACLFAPETSCEHNNRYLDRNLLVDTLSPGTAFFP